MKVLGIGEIVIDKTYIITDLLVHGQKNQSNESIISLGGPVPSALKLLKNLGCDVSIVGVVGNDSMPVFVQKQFDIYGINSFLIYDKITKTNTVLVNEKNGDRTIIKDAAQNKLIEEIPINLILEADIIVFDRSEPLAFDFVLKNKRPETKIVVDPSSEFSQKTIHMMKNSTIAILPIETTHKIGKHNDLETNFKKLYDQIGSTLIITDGGNGTYIFDGKKTTIIKTTKIKPIDTNGAGDVFRGGFTWGLLNNWGIRKTVIFANKVASLQCLKKGNLTAVPSIEEIKGFK